MGNRGWRMRSTVAGLVVFGAATAGCLEARDGLDSEGPPSGPTERSTMQIVAPFEEDDRAMSASIGELEACAEAGNSCLETSDDAAACLRAYGTCVVAAGVAAEHPYLGCLDGLASCWEGSSVDDDACTLAFEICVEPLMQSDGSYDNDEYPTPDGPPGLCEAEVVACYDNPANGDAVCAAVYRDCLVAAGVEGPYVDCLDDAVVCLGAGQDDDGCYLAFDVCVDAAYPSDDGWTGSEDDHGPGEEREPFLCEEPIWDCYDAGGTETQCVTVYRDCIVASGFAADDPRVQCLDALIICVEPAEASEDSYTALTACSDAYGACFEASTP